MKPIESEDPVDVVAGSGHDARALDVRQPEAVPEFMLVSAQGRGRMIPQMAKTEGVNEALKAHDPMAWVAQMNSIRHRAEESILTELIYG